MGEGVNYIGGSRATYSRRRRQLYTIVAPKRADRSAQTSIPRWLASSAIAVGLTCLVHSNSLNLVYREDLLIYKITLTVMQQQSGQRRGINQLITLLRINLSLTLNLPQRQPIATCCPRGTSDLTKVLHSPVSRFLPLLLVSYSMDLPVTQMLTRSLSNE